ncbi:MAG: single-stranded DNA-binding protein [Bacteroides sp.]|nr:single-stranded DNA-binding protein [Bacteroides sp.]
MEQINKIELRGNVGNVKLQTVGNNENIRFSIATNYAYKDKEGRPVIETTWHNVTAWNGKGMPDFHKIDKGTLVHVMGRLRTQKFEGNDGVEKQIYEVLANRIEIENCPEGTQPAFGI